MTYLLKKPYHKIFNNPSFAKYVKESEQQRSHKATKKFFKNIYINTKSDITKMIIKKILENHNEYLDKIYFVNDLSYRRHVIIYHSRYNILSFKIHNYGYIYFKEISNTDELLKKLTYVLKECPKIFIYINDSF